MKNVVIRKATEKDTESIYSLIASEPEKLKVRTREEIHGIIDCFFVADDLGKIVGCASLEIYSPKLGELRSYIVLPEYRGHGIGKALIAKCIELGKGNVLEILAITSEEGHFNNMGFGPFRDKEKIALFYSFRNS